MEIGTDIEKAYYQWYEALEKDNNGLPDWGPVCTGLVILERLKKNYNLDINYHRTDNGAQIKGQGISLGNSILKHHNIAMKLTSGEFGRTNRSSVPTAQSLLAALELLHLDTLSQEERYHILTELQSRLLPTLLRFSDRFQVEAKYAPTLSTEAFIKGVLAKTTPKTSGAVAQHLVGAKLELRFPDLAIPNHSASTADAPTERSGDFFIGDTVFHVTMAPGDLIYLKCRRNLELGLRVYLLVPEKKIQEAVRKAISQAIEEDIVIKSIESFIGQNIDELGRFSTELLQQEIKKLIDVYNRRICVERLAPELKIEEKVIQEENEAIYQLTLNDVPIISSQIENNE